MATMRIDTDINDARKAGRIGYAGAHELGDLRKTMRRKKGAYDRAKATVEEFDELKERADVLEALVTAPKADDAESSEDDAEARPATVAELDDALPAPTE